MAVTWPTLQHKLSGDGLLSAILFDDEYCGDTFDTK